MTPVRKIGVHLDKARIDAGFRQRIDDQLAKIIGADAAQKWRRAVPSLAACAAKMQQEPPITRS